jgi:hypothetical protein
LTVTFRQSIGHLQETALSAVDWFQQFPPEESREREFKKSRQRNSD